MENPMRQQYEGYVREGIEALPEWVQEKLVNVVFETLFGYYSGVPLTERDDEPPLMPDTIQIFMKPIREAYEREVDIRTCVRNTVWHEVAHYFGHDEAWVEEEERRRGKEL
jgi:predicted Zn-dependent protease with MMP-like domain